MNNKQSSNLKNPHKIEFQNLLQLYHNKKYDDAETLALSLTKRLPNHQFAWKVLGALLKQTGRISESLAPMYKSVQLAEKDTEARNNLGITLHELGRFNEAKAIFKQALSLKPDYVEALNNLGNVLQRLGSWGEAEENYRQAISLKPEYAEAHNNLGITLKELGRLDEAEVSYSKAISLKPEYAEAHNNLGITLKELGRLDEAEVSYSKAIAFKSDFAEAMLNLSINLSYMNTLESEIHVLQNVMEIDKDAYGLRAGVNLAICKFLEGSFEESRNHLLAISKIEKKTSSEYKNEKVYRRYLLNIFKWHEKNGFDYENQETDKVLHIIGESHSLVSHHLRIKDLGDVFFWQGKVN